MPSSGARLDENIAAADVQLTPNDLRDIDDATTGIEVRGARVTGQEKYG